MTLECLLDETEDGEVLRSGTSEDEEEDEGEVSWSEEEFKNSLWS